MWVRAVTALLAEGYDVVAATRNPDRLTDFGWYRDVTGVALDARDEASARAAFIAAGPIDVVYYLVHGIGQPGFRIPTPAPPAMSVRPPRGRRRTHRVPGRLGARR